MGLTNSFDDFIHVKGITYKLGSDLVWHVGSKDSIYELVIPKGTPFDSSVPRYLWWIVSPHHRPWLLAAAVHDELLKKFDKAFAAGEWYRAARAKSKIDNKSWLVKAAYYGVVLWTVR